MNRLQNRVALVTGAAQGIGQAIAARLAAEGTGVALLDIRETGETACLCRKNGGETLSLQTDISRSEEIRAAVAAVQERWGRLDILVNNAGIFDETPLTELPEERWDRVSDINIKAQFLFARQAAPLMIGAGWGRIINMASMAAKVDFPNEVAYCSSKSAVLGLTRALGVELGPQGITVNAICPGPIDTEMLKNTYQHLADQHSMTLDAWRADILQTIPVRRYGRPADVAALVAFLASDEAGFINAQAINIDGGMVFY